MSATNDTIHKIEYRTIIRKNYEVRSFTETYKQWPECRIELNEETCN